MTAADVKSNTALGFLTVVEHPQYGLFGGYLLLNTSGRPLEFHCTAPIKPNRAQQILYGPTLESFLYGEQIGQTLLRKANVEPSLVLTDRQPVLAVRQHVSMPVAWVLPADGREADPEGKSLAFEASLPEAQGLTAFESGRHRLGVCEQSPDDRRQIVEQLARLPQSFDLAEPFTRIRGAIEEAQQAVRSAACPAA